MAKVDSFLGCAKVETGALIIGWYTLITNILIFAVCLIMVIVMSAIFGCEDLKMLLKNDEPIPENFSETCSMVRGVIIGILVFLVFWSIPMIYMSHLCIKGMENRIHGNIKPLKITMAVFSICCFLNILSFNFFVVVFSVIYGLIYWYAYVVLHSVFELIKDENERGVNAQYHQLAAKV